MKILVSKKAKEQLVKLSEKELLEFKKQIKEDMEYSGVMKGILDNGQFYTADIYKSKDKKCIISEFFTHFHQNDAENSFLDFISSRTSKDGTWLI